MNLLRTDRTYKTQLNAYAALLVACKKLGIANEGDTVVPHEVKYLIAVNADGRFAPVVLKTNAGDLMFPHIGVTVVG